MSLSLNEIERMSASESKETDDQKPNHLTHVLNSPKTFIRMFTRENCTFEERQIQEILKPICALRNCGGGKLTILFTKICLKSEAEKCADIIKNAVDKSLSDTIRDDLLVCIHPRSIIFLARGSKKIVTMKYNLYFMTDSSPEFVSCTTSSDDIRLFLQKQNELSTERDHNLCQQKLRSYTSIEKKPSERLHSFRSESISDSMVSETKTLMTYRTCVSLMQCIPRKHKNRKNSADGTVSRKGKKAKGKKTKGKKTKGKKGKENKSQHSRSMKAEHGMHINDNSREEIKIVSIKQIKFVKGKQITELLKETVTFKMLKDDKSGLTNAASRIALEENELLPYISAYANHEGGTLLYGINSDGTVIGQKMLETEKKKISQTVKNKIATLVWPQHADKGDKFWEISFISVKNKTHSDLKLYVINISVKPCPGGVFIDEPESYCVVENRVEKLSFSKWMAHLQDSTTEKSSDTSFIEFKENEMAFDPISLPDDYQTILESLEWVESFRIAVENKECGTPHLEIVCKLGEVPRTADITERFGEQILPFITYQKASNRDWFENNIFDENCDIKQEYEDKLLSLPWVEDFYVGVTSEPEKSWQIFITCAPNTIPSMADLKKEFGTNIASFVEFIQESFDEDRKDSQESRPSSSYLRGPISGDELCVQGPKGGYGAIGIITGDSEKHYATTCYHVCFKEDFPKEDIKKGHEILKQDYANQSKGCKGAICLYTTEQEETVLGQFCHGLYDDNHDIALVELEPAINCSDTVEFLKNKNISPALADKKRVKEMFFDTKEKELPVEIIRRPEPTEGKLFAITGVRRCERNKRCYRIRRTGGENFAIEGDSGSLVYLIYEGEKIPFAYVCMVIPESNKVVYYCRSMNHSIEELIKKRMPGSSMKPCLQQCGQTTVG